MTRRSLTLERVGVTLGEREVLTDISLELTEARIGIIGANGSGKSTLARLFNGLVVPTTGTVSLGEWTTRRDGGAIRREVGFIFTQPDAQIVMPTVAEDVAFSLRRKSIPKARHAEIVERALARFHLDAHADHPAALLSGGQKQLLALCSVLVTNPSVMVADEPTTLLDRRNAAEIKMLLATLSQQVIVVTHDLELVRDFDRVILLDGGRVVADGAPDAAFDTYDRLPAPA